MNNVLLISVIILFLLGCDTSESDYSSILPYGIDAIENITITGNRIDVTTSYQTPNPCWYFHRNEITNDDNVFTSKVYGKYDGEVCVQMLGSFTRKERIVFSTTGVKTLRFWKNDSAYLDTTITLP